MIQLALGVLFAVVALLLREPIENDLFGGSSTLYWILLVSVLAYAVSYFARGYLAGHRLFPLYGGLVLMEASSRFLFALMALSAYDHGKYDGWFWNKSGFEYPAMWAIGVLYFLINGGGLISLDHLIGFEF